MFDEKPTEQKSLFDLEMDYEEVLEIPDDYLQVRLSEMEDKEVFAGKPLISGIITSEFDLDNEYDEEQYLDININLKKADYHVDAIRKGSVLFDFVQSILEIENKNSTKGKNIFRNVNLKQFTDFINNNVQTIAIKNLERKGNFNFNSFYVVKINNMEL